MNNLVTLLTVLFVGLKLTEVIDWSWWAVFSPVIFLALVLASLILLQACIDYRKGL